MNLETIVLFAGLCRFGQHYPLTSYSDPDIFLKKIKKFDNNWVPYNNRKKVNRKGLSITSADGGLSGIPDLDSLKEYNRENDTNYTEYDFVTKTPVYDAAREWLDPIAEHIGRTHLIKLEPGGFFPMHRDNNLLDIDSFRLFIPIINCNPPSMFFLLADKPLYFDHGRMYFINTSIEHVLFNASFEDSIFIVVNIALTEETVNFVLKNKQQC